MKRKEIYVAVIIDTISQNDCGDEAYIFNTKQEALDWAECIKKSMEDMGCPLCENQLFIQKVNTTIDYLNPPAGPHGPEVKVAQNKILGKFTAQLIAFARKLEKYGFDGMSEDEIKYCIQEFIREQGL